MFVVALSGWWTVGWLAFAAVVVVVAVLVLLITSVARKIDSEAREIVAGLDGVSGKTRALRDVGLTHVAVRRITNGLRRARGGGAAPAPNVGIGPGMRTPGPRPAQAQHWTRREN
ncbi:MAG: hypothetical protein ACR2LH_03335 [Thermoleophilaceae bacterium]|jgi:hypothetical protein